MVLPFLRRLLGASDASTPGTEMSGGTPEGSGGAESIGLLHPTDSGSGGGEGATGSFFDRSSDPSELSGIREAAIAPNSGDGPGAPGGGEGPDWGGSGAVSIGPKHEDPTSPPESMSSTVGGPGGGDGPGGDVGSGAVSLGPKQDDPSPPAPEGMSSTVGGPGGGGPGDVGTEMDEGPSTLMDSDGGGINLQGDEAPELGDLASGADMDLEGTLEP